MARKSKTRKRKKKGGWADGHEPSPEQRGAWRHDISVDRYVQLRRNHMREQERRNRLLENPQEHDVASGGDIPPEETEQQYISRILREERIRERRAREREEAERLVRRAYRVRNYLPQDVTPGNASLQQVNNAERVQYRELEQAREEVRRQADIRARTVHRVIQNPDGSIVMGRTIAPTEEQAKAMQIHAIAEEEGLSWMDAYRRYNEIHNININEIAVTRPGRLRRIRDSLVERARAIREGRLFGRRNRTSVVPTVPPQLGGRKRRKRRKKTRRKRRRGGTKRKRKEEDGPPTPRRAPRRRLNPPQQQQPQPQPQGEYDIDDAEVDEYTALMEHIEANVDPDDPNFFQGGKRKKRRKKAGHHEPLLLAGVALAKMINNKKKTKRRKKKKKRKQTKKNKR
tara:strand:+ start:1036 stop:2235 length:1200 start_codon:yes stop_codon:yes gene_type:complete